MPPSADAPVAHIRNNHRLSNTWRSMWLKKKPMLNLQTICFISPVKKKTNKKKKNSRDNCFFRTSILQLFSNIPADSHFFFQRLFVWSGSKCVLVMLCLLHCTCSAAAECWSVQFGPLQHWCYWPLWLGCAESQQLFSAIKHPALPKKKWTN